jgi:hypothetical protein
MKKKDTAKKVEARSCLNISDWVTLLSNERQGMMSNVVNFSVFLVAVIALILVTSGYIVFAVASGIIAFGCAGWVYFRVLEPLRQRGNLADAILKKIISGELKDADSIREEWVLGLAVIGRGWLRHGKGRLAAFKRAWRRQWKTRLAILEETWRPRWEAGLATLKEAWHRERSRLIAIKETWRPRWEAGLATLKEAWYRERPRLAALKETWRPRWETGLSLLKETRCRGKARLVALRETWRRQWEGGISYSQASVAPMASGTSYPQANMAPVNKSKQVRTPSRNKKSAT